MIENGMELAILKKISPFVLRPKFFAKKQNKNEYEEVFKFHLKVNVKKGFLFYTLEKVVKLPEMLDLFELLIYSK